MVEIDCICNATMALFYIGYEIKLRFVYSLQNTNINPQMRMWIGQNDTDGFILFQVNISGHRMGVTQTARGLLAPVCVTI